MKRHLLHHVNKETDIEIDQRNKRTMVRFWLKFSGKDRTNGERWKANQNLKKLKEITKNKSSIWFEIPTLSSFLGATKHLYIWLCPSVGRSVSLLVGQRIRSTIHTSHLIGLLGLVL